jgi:hypothetical protein
MIAVATAKDLAMTVSDISTAYLNAKSDTDIFMSIPQGMSFDISTLSPGIQTSLDQHEQIINMIRQTNLKQHIRTNQQAEQGFSTQARASTLWFVSGRTKLE